MMIVFELANAVNFASPDLRTNTYSHKKKKKEVQSLSGEDDAFVLIFDFCEKWKLNSCE